MEATKLPAPTVRVRVRVRVRAYQAARAEGRRRDGRHHVHLEQPVARLARGRAGVRDRRGDTRQYRDSREKGRLRWPARVRVRVRVRIGDRVRD